MDCPGQPTRSVTAQLDGAVWHRSSYSGTHGNCVEVAVNLPGRVVVRDSKDPDRMIISFSGSAWAIFTDVVKCGVWAENCTQAARGA